MNFRKDGGVEAPFTLKGLFGTSSDDGSESDYEETLNMVENQNLQIGDLNVLIRQTAFHPTNANKVWPGTFSLADLILKRKEK
jgi:hypothetical protein